MPTTLCSIVSLKLAPSPSFSAREMGPMQRKCHFKNYTNGNGHCTSGNLSMHQWQRSWVRSQHPSAQRNLRGGRWSSAEYSKKKSPKNIFKKLLYSIWAGCEAEPMPTKALKKAWHSCLLLFHLGVYRLLVRTGRTVSPKKAWPSCLLLFLLGSL